MSATVPRSSSDAGLLLQIGALLVDYWFDVDHNWGGTRTRSTPEPAFFDR